MRILVHQLVAALLLLGYVSVSGQPLAFKKLTIHEGLSQNSVNEIQFDRDGFLWAATADGLNRFDGYEFKQYRNSGPKEERLMNVGILSILCDKHGRVWIAGNMGLEVLDPATNEIAELARIPLSIGEAKWFEDDDNVFVFLKDIGVWQYDTRSFEKTVWRTGDDMSFTRDLIKISVVDQHPWLYLFPKGTSFYYKLNKRDHSYSKEQIFKSEKDFVIGTATLLKNNVAIFTASIDNHSYLVAFDLLKNKILKKGEVDVSNADPFYKGTLFAPDLNRIIVSDINRGLIFFDSTFREMNSYPNSTILSRHSESIIFQSAILKDNCLWIGSDPNGILYANLASAPFYHFKSDQNTGTSVIKGIFTDREENVYGGMLYEGVQVFDAQGNYVREMEPIGKDNQSLRLHAFNSFLRVGLDSVFIFCPNYLGFYNTHTRQHQNFLDQFYRLLDEDERLGMFQATMVMPTEFLISSRTGIWRVRFRNGRAQFSTEKISSSIISAIHYVDESLLLIGTTEGLFINTLQSSAFQTDVGKRFIKHISRDSKGNLWICTTEGLWHLDSNLKRLHYFSTDNGLSNNFTYGAVESGTKLWVSTNMGLSCIDLETYKIKNYTEADGLQSNEFNSGAFWKSSAGTVYFGGINGINSINPGFENTNDIPFKVIVTQIKVNDQEVASTNSQLDLAYDQNTVVFSFAGVLPAFSQQIKYRYRMEGLDRDWVSSDKIRTARYPNVPPGTYTFRVAASVNQDLFLNEAQATVIRIESPWWQSWWFNLLVVTVIGSLAWMTRRYFESRKARKAQEAEQLEQRLETERQRISRDLHDNIGSYTTALLANAQQLRSFNDQSLAHVVDMMHVNATKILGSLRETIWVLSHHSISLLEFSDNFKSHCIRLLHNYPQIRFETREDVVVDRVLPASQAFHLSKILQEAVENSVKHSGCSLISFSVECDKTLTITLADNGTGFDKNLSSGGHGFGNMKWRAKEAAMILHIDSSASTGTSVVITERYSQSSIESV